MNTAGIIDLVPQNARRRWREDGSYPNRDVFDLFRERAGETPDKPAVLSPEGHVSYAELLGAALRLAGSLRQSGIVAGDVVAYQLSNSWRCCAIDLAVAALGAIVAPFPPGRGKLDIQALVRRCDARAVIVGRPSTRCSSTRPSTAPACLGCARIRRCACWCPRAPSRSLNWWPTRTTR